MRHTPKMNLAAPPTRYAPELARQPQPGRDAQLRARKCSRGLLALLILAASLGGCVKASHAQTTMPHPTPAPSTSSRPWLKAESFAFQLQDVKLEEIQASDFDIVVIDYSLDGSASGKLTRSQVQLLKRQKNGERRLVLCYFSIGEAESYREYWKPEWRPGQPGWLDDENPHFRGNYKVRFWDPEWQAVLFGKPQAYLDQILAAGFDGVYLDIIDGYEYYQERGIPDADRRMITLVQRLTSYARKRAGADFGIFPQNGDLLLTNPEYRDLVTGVGREDTYYGAEREGLASPEDFTRSIEKNLRLAVEHGKLVLNVDYTTNPRQIKDAHERAASQGYLEYTTTRPLDRLIQVPGLQP